MPVELATLRPQSPEQIADALCARDILAAQHRATIVGIAESIAAGPEGLGNKVELFVGALTTAEAARQGLLRGGKVLPPDHPATTTEISNATALVPVFETGQ
jgi:hypothetical protein